MNDQTILIVGANGQLGQALRAKYTGARTSDSDTLDITSISQLEKYDWSGIQTIINAAAFTDVDRAESPEGRISSWKVNAEGAANLASIAIGHDLTLLHISSDYVFDGTNELHTEEEEFSPLGVYGQSKAAGDIAVALVPKHYILRTSWVIGEGKNFVRTMLDLGKRNIAPTVVNDQVGRLTFTSELVAIIDHLLATSAAYGTYNATNTGETVSWADITRAIFQIAGFNLVTTGISTVDYFKGKSGIAPRPLNSVMDLSKLQASGYTGHDWHEDLRAYVQKELAK